MSELAYVSWDPVRARAVVEAQAHRQGALLPVLHDLQGVFGCVPPDAVPIIADVLNLSRAEIHGVLTFYHDVRERPPGRRVVRACRAEACQAMGGPQVAETLLARLGVGWGETTGDGEVTVEPAYCLGLCAVAPAALVDGQPVGRATADELLRRLGAAA